jgi:hypothetical protein
VPTTAEAALTDRERAQVEQANANSTSSCPRCVSSVSTRPRPRIEVRRRRLSGDKDHTAPWAIANAAYKRQRRNPSITEIEKVSGHGHALTIDEGWRDA